MPRRRNIGARQEVSNLTGVEYVKQKERESRGRMYTLENTVEGVFFPRCLLCTFISNFLKIILRSVRSMLSTFVYIIIKRIGGSKQDTSIIL